MNISFSAKSDNDEINPPDSVFFAGKLHTGVWSSVLLVMFLVVLCLRMIYLLNSPFSTDDFADLDRATTSIYGRKMTEEIRYNPPLHQLPKKAAILISGRLATIRIMFVFFSALLIPAIFFTARRYYNESSALAASFLAMFNDHLFYISTSSRGLGLSLLFLLMALYFYHDVLYKGTRHRAYLIFSLLALYSHYFTLSVLFFQVLYLVLTRHDTSTKKLAVKIALYGFPAICMIVYGMSVRNAEYPQQGVHSSILFFMMYLVFLATTGILFMIFAIIFSPDKRHKGLIYTTILSFSSVLFINIFYEVKLSLLVIIFQMIWIFFCGVLFYRVRKIVNIALWAVFILSVSVSFFFTVTHYSDQKRVNINIRRITELIAGSSTHIIFFENQTDLFNMYGVLKNDIPLFDQNVYSLTRNCSSGYYVNMGHASYKLITKVNMNGEDRTFRGMDSPFFWLADQQPGGNGSGNDQPPAFCMNYHNEKDLFLCRPPGQAVRRKSPAEHSP